ncbi:MAG: uncharacterized protein PWQ12_2151 [Clostridiales bacterium]|jgi:hypothetical protein|nr:uncharacterized protein [Clostridiales bacterium]
MVYQDLEGLALALNTFAVFDKLLEDSVISELKRLIEFRESDTRGAVRQYTRFVSALYNADAEGNFTDYLWQKLRFDDNLYIRSGGRVQAPVSDACEHELDCLESLSQISSDTIQKRLGYDAFLPSWKTENRAIKKAYADRAKQVSKLGYGMYAAHAMFTVKEGALMPVKIADPIRLSDLKGYETERQTVIDNTRALIEGKTAANALLYGDAGTGKSSTIKAVSNAFRDEGLRLIEVPKREMEAIPIIMEALSTNPLKFIIFIDDLSFAQEGDDMSTLKTILEGSVAAKTPNIVIYATSNRRHLVKENFTERGNDDVHANETLQEKVSLSGRFGLSIHFGKPNQERYLSIVKALTERYGIDVDEAGLCIEAERFALERGGRSPRLARQFVESLMRRQA